MKGILITGYVIIYALIALILAKNTSIITNIDSLLVNSYSENEPGVSVMIVQNNKVLLKKAYGLANLESNSKMQVNNVFKISSVTKPITALGIFVLADQGKISLSAPITDYVPQLNKRYYAVQVKHLLSHTSGMPSYAYTDEYEELYIKHCYHFMNEEISGDSIFSIINKYDLEFEPGERFAYCNSGDFILEKIIENVSGKKFEDFMRENVLKPLNMKSSRFFNPMEIIPDRVTGYTCYDGEIVNDPPTFLSGILTKGQGEILSTTEDLYSFYLGITQNDYFRKISFDRYITPYTLNDSSESVYSYGFFTGNLKGHEIINHNGDGSGFSSSLVILPDENIFIAILSNNDMYSRGASQYHENIAKKIAAILIDKPFPVFKEIDLNQNEMKSFVGTYQSEDRAIREVMIYRGN